MTVWFCSGVDLNNLKLKYLESIKISLHLLRQLSTGLTKALHLSVTLSLLCRCQQ